MRHQEKTKRGIEALLCAALLACGIARAQTNRYVRWNNPSPSPGYLTWAAAATNINDAIDVASVGDTIWVTNGTYDTGGRVAAGGLTNRVYINKAVTVRSVNGLDYTFVSGKIGAGGWGSDAIRCAFLTNAATLIGFSLTNGGTTSSGSTSHGGGAYCGSVADTISNCVIASSRAAYGGGVRGGTVYDSVIRNNTGNNFAGGAYTSMLYNCLITVNNGDSAGGALWCTLYNCFLLQNSARHYWGGGGYNSTLYGCTLIGNTAGGNGGGGGAVGSTLYSCLIAGNFVRQQNGGGANGCTLYNCTVVGNAVTAGTYAGGGVYGGAMYNCIVHNNSAGVSNNYHSSTLVYSCSLPLPGGQGNIDSDPMLVDPGTNFGLSHVLGDYRLRRGSPCINTGTNFAWMTDAADPRSRDLDGAFRINFPGATVDMGAYEFIPKGTTFMLRGQ